MNLQQPVHLAHGEESGYLFWPLYLGKKFESVIDIVEAQQPR